MVVVCEDPLEAGGVTLVLVVLLVTLLVVEWDEVAGVVEVVVVLE